VDYPRGIIDQQVFTGVLRSYTGTSQPRPFRLVGRDPIIGDEKTYIGVSSG